MAAQYLAVQYTLVGLTFTTDELIAWGTVALVIVGGLTVVANALAISAAKDSAAAAKRSADAASAQVRLAFPELDVTVKPIAPESQQAVVTIRWLGGAIPARKVEVVVRGPSYSHRAELALVGPSDQGGRLELPTADGIPYVRPTAGKVWRSIAWDAPDGQRRVVDGEIDVR